MRRRLLVPARRGWRDDRRDRLLHHLRRRPLLLQPRVIARRRRHRRGRGKGRNQGSPSGKASDQKCHACSLHTGSPCNAFNQASRRIGAISRPARVQFIALTCSGVSPGDPLPSASALLISATTRRDSGTSARAARPLRDDALQIIDLGRRPRCRSSHIDDRASRIDLHGPAQQRFEASRRASAAEVASGRAGPASARPA